MFRLLKVLHVLILIYYCDGSLSFNGVLKISTIFHHSSKGEREMTLTSMYRVINEKRFPVCNNILWFLSITFYRFIGNRILKCQKIYAICSQCLIAVYFFYFLALLSSFLFLCCSSFRPLYHAQNIYNVF